MDYGDTGSVRDNAEASLTRRVRCGEGLLCSGRASDSGQNQCDPASLHFCPTVLLGERLHLRAVLFPGAKTVALMHRPALPS